MKKRHQLPEEGLKASIDGHKTVFQLGLQGPDIFFYHLSSNLRQSRPGSIVHEIRTGDFLQALIQAAELFQNPEDAQIAQAYAAGFLGHYLLDSQMHPYVYYRAACQEAAEFTPSEIKVRNEDIGIHVALETDMDTCLLMRYAKCLPSEFPHYHTIQFDRHTRQIVAQVLYHAFAGVFPELGLTRNALYRAILAMQTETRFLYNPRNTKREKAEWLEKKLFGRLVISTIIPCDELRCSTDPLNLEKKEWQNPWQPGRIYTDSVIEMIKKASGRYRKALLQLNEIYKTPNQEARHEKARQLIDFLGHKSYHSGLCTGERN